MNQLTKRVKLSELRVYLRSPTIGLFIGVVLLGCGCKRSDPSHDSNSNQSANPAKAEQLQLSKQAGALGPVMAHNSAECIDCAVKNCQAKIDICNHMEGDANDGPAKGKSRRQLCVDTFDCAIKSRCVTKDTAMRCFCGSAKGLDCISEKANGACRSKLEAGLETTDPKTLAMDYIKPKTGGGAAMDLVQCMIDSGCSSCF